jgi:hypothetical protein
VTFRLQTSRVPTHERVSPLHISAYLVSFGTGLQNGMCTTFSGAVLRTTHMTGILTDIGILIGHAIFHPRTRKRLWKLKIFVPLYVAFGSGGFTGWYAYQLLKEAALLLACLVVGALAVGHLSYWKGVPLCKKLSAARRPSMSDAPARASLTMVEVLGEHDNADGNRPVGRNINET